MATMAEKLCFHPTISMEEADNLLREKGKVGSFLVRPSERCPRNFAISVRKPGEVHHISIKNTGDYYYINVSEFASLPELMEYYTEQKLQYPLSPEDSFTDRWFHGRLNKQEATKMLKNAEDGWFFVWANKNIPFEYFLSVMVKIEVLHVKINCHNKKYGIDSDEQFDTLSDLVEHRRSNTTKRSTLHLKQPVNNTRITTCSIKNRMAKLEEPVCGQGPNKSGFGQEFHQLQFEEWKKPLSSRTEGQRPENISKNRFKHILPFDQTRVVLRDCDPQVKGSDYINANQITNTDEVFKDRCYIATQGCLQDTAQDFWRMVWQENCSIIVMATQLNEDEIEKCAKYWPDEKDEQMEIDLYKGKLIITYTNEINTSNYVLRSFTMCKKGEEDQARRVYQHHFTAWLEYGVPKDAISVLEVLEQINVCQASLFAKGEKSSPILVHCCAGTGRTGTLIVIDMIIKKIQAEGLGCEFDIPDIVKMVRAQRSGLIQTEAQYTFVYTAVQHYITTKHHKLTIQSFDPALTASQFVFSSITNQKTLKPEGMPNRP